MEKKNLRKAQILIPAVLVIPSLLIFIYLLFETTKISREKIKQQLALDSAAFIQMTDFTNFLNRTAYVNGPFPYRIFKQLYDCGQDGMGTMLDKSDQSGQTCTFELFWKMGAYPKYVDDVEYQSPDPKWFDGKTKWDIRFDETFRPGINTPKPDLADEFIFFNADMATKYMFFWDPIISFYKQYVQVYSILGSIEASQFSVFDRLTQNMNFFRKSFYLNAATKKCLDNPELCGNEGLSGWVGKKLKPGDVKMHYIKRIKFWAKSIRENVLMGPGYDIAHSESIDMTQMAPQGLFQLTTVDEGKLSSLGKGYELEQSWEPGNTAQNYFGVNLNALGNCKTTPSTCVHVTVASQCSIEGNNCVWPFPTPRYQTRLYP